MTGWWDTLRQVVGRNRPNRKPQLWEDFRLAAGRRARFEIGRRFDPDWLDRPHIVRLSKVGFSSPVAPLKIELVPRELMNQAIFLYGAFEISETRLVQALLRPGMTFVDVGANIGYYTLVAARLVGDHGLVHSFEPHDELRARLGENLRRNGLDNVVVHSEAIADASGEVEFFASTWGANQGISSIIRGGARGDGRTVKSLSLDDFFSTLAGRRVDLVKMDIEGAELRAIEGGVRTFRGIAAPPLIFEGHEIGPLVDALKRFDYKIRRIHYTLEGGLELPAVDAPSRSLFEAYEAPNYFAAKDDAVFEEVLARANGGRSPLLCMLGRL